MKRSKSTEQQMETVLIPHREHGQIYWIEADIAEEDPDNTTLCRTLTRLAWSLVRLFGKLLLWLLKWTLVIAFYGTVFFVFLLIFAVLFSS